MKMASPILKKRTRRPKWILQLLFIYGKVNGYGYVLSFYGNHLSN